MQALPPRAGNRRYTNEVAPPVLQHDTVTLLVLREALAVASDVIWSNMSTGK